MGSATVPGGACRLMSEARTLLWIRRSVVRVHPAVPIRRSIVFPLAARFAFHPRGVSFAQPCARSDARRPFGSDLSPIGRKRPACFDSHWSDCAASTAPPLQVDGAVS